MKKILLVLLLAISNISSADQWTAEVNVIEIFTGYKEGFILFKTDGVRPNPANCPQADLYSVEPNNADVSSVLAVLLAAQKSKTKVTVAVDSDRCGSAGVEHLANKLSVSRISTK